MPVLEFVLPEVTHRSEAMCQKRLESEALMWSEADGSFVIDKLF